MNITYVEPGIDGRPPALRLWSLSGQDEVSALRAAIGLEQLLTPTTCQPCVGGRRIVFANPLGLHIGEVQIDCPGVAKGHASFRLGATPTCARIAIENRAALDRLLIEYRPHDTVTNPLGLP